MVKNREYSCKEETCIQKTPVALIQQSMTNIEKSVNDMTKKLDDFIKTCDEKYTTKFEHNTNTERINKIEEVLSRLNWIII